MVGPGQNSTRQQRQPTFASPGGEGSGSGCLLEGTGGPASLGSARTRKTRIVDIAWRSAESDSTRQAAAAVGGATRICPSRP